MRFLSVHSDQPAANPLDIVEQLAIANDWPFERQSADEIAVEVPGHWCNYSLYFAWREDLGAMHFTSAYDMRVGDAKQSEMYELLALVNERMWIGHFGLWSEEGVPMFRHSLLARIGEDMSGEQVEELVEIALNECERFFPAFQFVVWGGKSPADAVACAMFDTMGEA